MVRGIVWFAAGCAVAALLYYRFGFWCLAVPIAIGAATTILRDDEDHRLLAKAHEMRTVSIT
jgi:hypothetical protein